jgi:GT2 family glycosyltransferase
MSPSENAIPSCSVVVCTCDRPDLLARCLDALAEQTYPSFQVIVVDNAPRTGRVKEVALARGARYVVEPEPGLSRARNRGARAADTEIVAFLDDDALPDAGWLEALCKEFSAPQVVAVAGRIYPLNVERVIPPTGEPRHVDRDTPAWFEMTNFGGIGSGSNMAFRRAMFDVWPGFDHRLGRGALVSAGEENYAFFTLVKQGYCVVATPRAIVYHPVATTWWAVRRRQLRNAIDAVGYFVLLFVRQRGYRFRILRYLVQGLVKRPRAWRRNPSLHRLPRLHSLTLLACLVAPVVYLGKGCRALLRRCFRRRSLKETATVWPPLTGEPAPASARPDVAGRPAPCESGAPRP